MQELRGVGVALATPLNKDYSIDYASLGKLIDHIVNGGVDYLVVMGTTAEAPVFSWNEKLKVLEFVFEKTSEKVPIVFGHGGNHTFNLIERTKDLKDYPLAAILSASPYYSRPSQQGIIRHYEMLGEAFPHPIVLYNVPSRTASNMEADTTLKLARHANIIGIKEASVDMAQCKQIIDQKPDEFLFLSGNDHTTFDLLKMGGQGVISVLANLMPSEFKSLVDDLLSNQSEVLHDPLIEAYELSSLEGNPSSLKAGLEAAGICDRIVKPPLFDGSDELVEKWKKYLKIN